MIIFPAIDLFDGKVVRLSEGDFARKTEYGLTPLDAAKSYRESGCGHIHVVDLEGAECGFPRHLKELEEIASLGMFVQFGGGLRSVGAIRQAVSSGADRLMIGSLLFKNEEMPQILMDTFGDVAMPAIDVRDGQIVSSGWLEATGRNPGELIKKLNLIGFKAFLVTDTERDGLLQGVRKGFYEPLVGGGYEIIAAGGITTVSDIACLAGLGIGGAVVGKALYEGRITIEEAKAAGGEL